MKKSLLVVAALAALAGCAAPTLSNDQVAAYARGWYLTDQCVVSGRLDPETAATGRNYIRQAVSRSGNPGDFQEQVRILEGARSEVTAADCSQAAMMIMEVKGRQTQRAAAATQAREQAKSAESAWPTITNCNRIAGQVMCSTY